MTDTPYASSNAANRMSVGLVMILAGLAAIGALSTNIILPAFPALANELHVSQRDLGVTLATFFVAFAFGQLLVGPLSDRFGRRPLVVGGLAVFLIGTFLCISADKLDTLILGRVIQALGVCAASVLSRAIARDLFEGEALSRSLSLTMIAMAAAPGFSPLLGGLLASAFGWQATFVFVGLAALLLGTFYVVGVGETLHASHRRAQSIAVVGQDYFYLIRLRHFTQPALAVGLVVGGIYAFFGATPAILIGGMGFTPIELGLFFAATVFIVFAAGLMAPRMARRLGSANAAVIGASIAFIGGIILLLLGKDIGLTGFSTAVTAFLFGVGLVTPLGTAMTLQPFANHAGIASALLGFLQMLFAALGTTLATSLPFSPITSLGVVLVGGTVPSIAFLLLQRGE
ncbi:hypothetical protein N185_17180 [Sinorhizobium sp. GW3]|nr:hypothetical protein N185_17180 [Sinorhizobium sp. GW3]